MPTTTTERDPKQDPRPGDRFEKDGLVRIIHTVFPGPYDAVKAPQALRFSAVLWYTPTGAAVRRCGAMAWVKWARTAQVVRSMSADMRPL